MDAQHAQPARDTRQRGAQSRPAAAAAAASTKAAEAATARLDGQERTVAQRVLRVVHQRACAQRFGGQREQTPARSPRAPVPYHSLVTSQVRREDHASGIEEKASGAWLDDSLLL